MSQTDIFKYLFNRSIYFIANYFDKIDSNNDGLISQSEFLSWRTTDSEPNNIYLFKSYDINEDGVLNVSEFVPLVYALNRTPSSEGEKLFNLLDSNNDGILTKTEVFNSNEKIPIEISYGLFQVADSNNDGNITLQEFLSVVDSTSSVEQSKNIGTAKSLLQAIDINGDDKLNKAEVGRFARKFNRISEAELNNVFLLLDYNKDGYLSVSELMKLPEKITELAGISSLPQV